MRTHHYEAEWAARRCECGADDACAFARERDAAEAKLEQVTKERDEAVREADHLRVAGEILLNSFKKLSEQLPELSEEVAEPRKERT